MCLKIKKNPTCSSAAEMLRWRQRCLGSAALQLIASLFFGFTTRSGFWCFSGRPLCVLPQFAIAERQSQKLQKGFFFLFIFLFIQPFFFFHAAALFPRRTNVLQLIENDPLTAVWNNEASFPHIFSRRMAALSCTSVHIKVPYQGGIWGWRNYWSAWEPGPPYLLLLHRGRDGIMEPKARLSVRRQWLDNAWEGCFLGILDNSVFKSGCIKGNQKATRNLWAVMGSIYDIIASKCVYLALK